MIDWYQRIVEEAQENRLRREKLGALFFELVKYVVTIGVIGAAYASFFTNKPLPWRFILLNLAIAAYFITPRR